MLLAVMMLATIQNSKATMICTDMEKLPKATPVNNSMSMCEKGNLAALKKQTEESQSIAFKTDITQTSEASAGVKTPSWTRYILVTLMALGFTKYLIAELARRKCNRLVRDSIMYYVHFKCDPDKARKYFN